jgi:predicted aldo/keto reductase-like oxidoreductase
LAHIYDKALRYAFGLPIDTAIIGMESMEQLQKNLAIAENYQPLSDSERLELYREILPLVTPEYLPWKSNNWAQPTAWIKRE